MDTLFDLELEVHLEVIGSPNIKISINDYECDMVLSAPYIFRYTSALPKSNPILKIEHKNKSNLDSSTAIIIKEIVLNNLHDPKFAWSGVYRPIYPQPWASTQDNLKQELPSVTHLGWNGIWELNLSIPIFTWIHNVRHLGWIYD
jgi:hypothetical protein